MVYCIAIFRVSQIIFLAAAGSLPQKFFMLMFCFRNFCLKSTRKVIFYASDKSRSVRILYQIQE